MRLASSIPEVVLLFCCCSVASAFAVTFPSHVAAAVFATSDITSLADETDDPVYSHVEIADAAAAAADAVDNDAGALQTQLS